MTGCQCHFMVSPYTITTHDQGFLIEDRECTQHQGSQVAPSQ